MQYSKLGNQGKLIPLSIESTEYNNLGEVIAVKEYTDVTNQANTVRETKLYHDDNGNIETINDPVGNEISFQYDSLNQLGSVLHGTFLKWSYDYDEAGNLSSVTKEGSKVTSYQMDPDLNLVNKVTYPSGLTSNFAYNPSGTLTNIKHSVFNNAIIFDTYDSGLPKTVTGINKEKSIVYYDEALNISKMITFDGNQEYHTYLHYNDLNQLERRFVQKKNGEIIADESFVYDKHGNRIKNTFQDGSVIDYVYDLADRIEKVTYNYINEPTSIQEFKYDEMGNITSILSNGVTKTFKYNSVNELINDSGVSVHDNNGNLESNGSLSFKYNVENNLMSIENSTGATLGTYDYNHEGLRTTKTVDGKTENYYYVGGYLAFITDTTNKLIYSFTRDAFGSLLTMTDHTGIAPVNYFYQKNYRGDILGIRDTSGKEVVSYRYDAYGNIVKSTGSKTLGNGKLLKDENPFRYASYFYDKESGLYYLNARYFDPSLGRFITRDVIPAVNLYAYSGNNPVNFVDPSGYAQEDPGSGVYGGSISELGNDINNKNAEFYDTGGVIWSDSLFEGTPVELLEYAVNPVKKVGTKVVSAIVIKGTGNSAADDIISNIPSNAKKRNLTPTDNIKEGVEYKWNDGATWRVRMHSEDLSAPIGSNANMGWTMRVQRGKWFMDSQGNWHKNNLLNKNSPFFNETIANQTHISIKRH
ncbi:polymorphic toxin type 30 domain-containing protein [Bacillus salitolerans]|uniref:Polymorphic toxin type 30 domain-containing protein n=1 Tax=Bacillus salitolerans TaxID=1437434 RepID=A0ABW4LWI2_9BACI